MLNQDNALVNHGLTLLSWNVVLECLKSTCSPGGGRASSGMSSICPSCLVCEARRKQYDVYESEKWFETYTSQ